VWQVVEGLARHVPQVSLLVVEMKADVAVKMNSSSTSAAAAPSKHGNAPTRDWSLNSSQRSRLSGATRPWRGARCSLCHRRTGTSSGMSTQV